VEIPTWEGRWEWGSTHEQGRDTRVTRIIDIVSGGAIGGFSKTKNGESNKKGSEQGRDARRARKDLKRLGTSFKIPEPGITHGGETF